MDSLFTILSFLVAITVLVGFHELGHFFAARFFGVKVLTFSIGFGRSIWSIGDGVDKTKFSLGAIPLGGYVRMLDESDNPSCDEIDGTFSYKPAWQKALIALAGPIANFILTFVLFAFVFGANNMSLKPVLGEPQTDSLFYSAGLKGGETLVRINDRRVDSWSDLRWEMTRFDSDRLNIEVAGRDSINMTLHSFNVGDRSASLFWTNIGLEMPKVDLNPVIGLIDPSGTASESDLLVGDRIVSVDQLAISTWNQFVEVIRAQPGESVDLTVERDKQLSELSLTIGMVDGSVGQIGVAPDPSGIMQEDLVDRDGLSVLQAMTKSLQRTGDLIGFTTRMIVGLIAGDVGLDNLAGPLVIADQAGKTAEMGLVTFLSFLAILSVSLGVINLFPLPMLDGGHIVFHLYELILGKRMPERVIVTAQQIGMVCLVGLMVFVIANDFLRYLGN
ncbi:MAG: RIP metalloprotease RseP [Burkholderiales bacterium]|nr:RIP metalloprotease RseP [Burkholderiales bacterium]OUT76801.1 MAG: RIP metalloprotease RseP [Betaproteobacteria bacterium TMED22]|tara:strand:- start:50979 stop:52316 length:1338 start_codon:yes stop_codon:yes gene_type:complete